MGGCSDCNSDNKDYPDDLRWIGITPVSTADGYYKNYIPHGWSKRRAEYDWDNKEVSYTAIPAYKNIEWTPFRVRTNEGTSNPCFGKNKKCRDRKSISGAYLSTGIDSNQGRPGYYQAGGRSYTLPEDARIVDDLGRVYGLKGLEGGWKHLTDRSYKSRGKTPPSLPRCNNCWFGGAVEATCVNDAEIKTDGPPVADGATQLLCAKDFDKENTCQAVGRITALDALREIHDAEDGNANKNVTSLDTRFKNNRHYGDATCVYPEDALETASQVVDMTEKIQNGDLPGDFFFTAPLLYNFCTKIIDNSKGGACISANYVDPLAKRYLGADHEVAECSRFFATDQSGDICRTFMEDLYGKSLDETPITYDELLERHCRSNPHLNECKCVNRDMDSVYVKTVKYNSDLARGNAYCWWAPCREGIRHGMFQDSEIRRIAEGNMCYATICANVVDFYRSNYNEASGLMQKTTCTFGNEGSQNDGGGIDNDNSSTLNAGDDIGDEFTDPSDTFQQGTLQSTTNKDNTGGGSSSSSSFLDKLGDLDWKTIGIGIIVFMVLVIGGFMYMSGIFKGKEKETVEVGVNKKESKK